MKVAMVFIEGGAGGRECAVVDFSDEQRIVAVWLMPTGEKREGRCD